MRSTSSILSAVNSVNAVNKVNTVQNPRVRHRRTLLIAPFATPPDGGRIGDVIDGVDGQGQCPPIRRRSLRQSSPLSRLVIDSGSCLSSKIATIFTCSWSMYSEIRISVSVSHLCLARCLPACRQSSRSENPHAGYQPRDSFISAFISVFVSALVKLHGQLLGFLDVR